MHIHARVMDLKTGEVRQLEDPAAIAASQLSHVEVVWLDVQAPGAAEVELLRRAFGIHPLTLEDIGHAHQRPKLEQYDGYLQLVLYEFVPREDGGEPATSELMLLIGAGFVVSLHHGPTRVCEAVGERWALLPDLADEMATYLGYLLVDAAVDSYFTIIEDLAEELDGLEDAVVAGGGEEAFAAIFALKKRMLHVRRLITPLRDVFLVLMRGPGSHFGTKTYIYFQDVLDHLLRIGDAIDVQRDILQGAIDLYMSALSNRTNDTMKKLTVLSTVLMTMALIAGIYGMNFKFMPELGWPRGYYGALWAMATAAWVLIASFRWFRYIGTTRRGAHPIWNVPIAAAGVACAAWGAWLWSPSFAAPAITRAEFLALRPGMDLAAAEAVVGQPGEETTREIDGHADRQVFTWSNPDGSWATATFENGKLASRAFERHR